MGRIRTIKPEFFTHEELFDLEEKEGLPVRLAFIGLWTICDREGRFKWRPRSIKAQILPYDNVDFSRVLDALATRGFVVRYASEGVEYGYVPGFSRHQVVNFKEAQSTLPEPSETNDFVSIPRVLDACLTRAERVAYAPSGEGKGKEEEGKGIGREQEQEGERGRIEAAEPLVSVSQKRTRRPSVAIDRPEDISEHHWRDWTACRRKPVTESVLVRIRREAAKAGMSADEAIRTAAERQWEGFQADWLNSDRTLAAERKPSQPKTFAQIREENTKNVFQKFAESGKFEALYNAVRGIDAGPPSGANGGDGASLLLGDDRS
jgi:hypothetical protein